MRLLTRSDFDGLVCAVLLKEIDLLDSWKFVHPKDVQEGIIEVTEDDILANVPYIPGVGLCSTITPTSRSATSSSSASKAWPRWRPVAPASSGSTTAATTVFPKVSTR